MLIYDTYNNIIILIVNIFFYFFYLYFVELSTLLAGFGDKGVSQLRVLPMIGYTEPYGFGCHQTIVYKV